MTRALTKGLNVTIEKESIVLKKNATTLKFEGRLYHGNGDGYLLDARIYASPNDARKMYLEGKKPEGKNLTKAEGTEATTENTPIKRETIGQTKANKKVTEYHDTTDCDTEKRLT